MGSVSNSTHPQSDVFSHLRSDKSSYRLNQIEKIRANGVGDVIDLPQLVVCGDQSAGKSSVLEGITGIPFPRQDGLCTRFPTEITLRHQENTPTIITAKIRPHASRTQDARTRLAAYHKDIKHMSELPSVINEVSKIMNIRGYTNDPGAYAFAPDALRIEISGNLGLHLSVVDLPGLISVANEEQTEEDVQAVHNMVTMYLESTRSIILAVLQASNDMANQAIIKIAKQHDPQGQRTVGIITKPDLINEGTETKLALVAKNQDNIKLKLGFFLLKNPSPSEMKEGLTMETRSQREVLFFSKPMWARQNLDPDRIGAKKLRVFLQELLDTHIENELPKVRDEIRKLLSASEAELKGMGDARPTVGHIRSFITSLSMKFYELLQAALEGNYASVDPEFFECLDSRLRALIQKKNTAFADYMRDHGTRRRIVADGTPSNAQEAGKKDQINLTEKDMIQWINQCYYRTRGKELPGNYNSALLSELFKEQSYRWASLSEEHVHDILAITSKWAKRAIARLVLEDSLRVEVTAILEAWFEKTEQSALDELELLLADERRSPLTYNHYYTDNVQKWRLETQRVSLKSAATKAFAQLSDGRFVSTSKDIDALVSTIETRITVNMDEQACKEARNELSAYYKVAMKTFVDNVARQVIERHIVSPLTEAFCPNSVSQLSDEALLAMGSESKHQVAQRNKLTALVKGLKASLRDMQKPIPN